MLVRSYSHIVFLICANIFNIVTCQEKSSLSFVIDNTYSMYDDIQQVKENANAISQVVFEEKASQIRNMVLVTFNDPEYSLVTATEDRKSFKDSIDSIRIYGGGDCPEVSMTGLLFALQSSLPGSFIYVFTDASAKDYSLSNEVKNMCQKKQSQIIFVLTGYCYSRNDEGYKVYYDIAAACAGLAFDVEKYEVNQILTTIKETIKGNKTILTDTKIQPYVETPIKFTIDDQTEYAIVTVSGLNVLLSVSGPPARQEQLTWLQNAKSIKLSELTPGTYTARVWGSSETSLHIVGRTDFIFHHGFSNLQPKSLKDTTPQPIANTPTILSIAVGDPKHTVEILSAQILDMDDRVINQLYLTEISKDFYTTTPFKAPSHRFKIAVLGRAVHTGQNIKRVAKLSVTPQEPERLPTPKIPDLTIPEGKSVEVTYAQATKLTCKVSAYPEPIIEWIDEHGVTLKSENSVVEPPYEYISYLTISDVTNNGVYRCRARNNKGVVFGGITVIVKDPFIITSVPEAITEIKYRAKSTLRCDITSSMPMHIKWYAISERLRTRTELITSDRYSISDDGTALTINKMELDMNRKYRCVAILDEYKDKTAVYETQVRISGLEKPTVTGDNNINALKGSSVQIRCHVTGVPKPTITWFFKATDDSKFKSISESQSTLYINNVDVYQAGIYKCVAQNFIALREHLTTLSVHTRPTITTSSSEAYYSIEGKDSELNIPCTVTGLPKPVITWMVNGTPITESAKHTIKDGTLVIREPKVSDTREYTCVAKNDAGSDQATFQANVFQKPKVNGEESKTLKKGDFAIIHCNIVKGVPKPTITWYFKGKNSSESKLTTRKTELGILKAENSHTGTYKCVAENTVGRDELLTEVTVEFAPVIIYNGSGILEGVEGDIALRIPCETEGVPEPSVTWKMDGKIVINSAKYLKTDGALIIKEPHTNDSKSYTCEAENYLGHARVSFTANVNSYIDKLGPIQEVNILSGTSTKLECGSTDPSQSIKWFQEGGETNITGKYFHLLNVDVSSESNYTCRVSDINGKTITKTFIVIVGFKPDFAYAQEEPLFDWDGTKDDVLDCNVYAKPTPNFAWTYNGKLLKDKTSAELTLSDNWGQYSCNVSNVHGSVQRNFEVVSSKCLITRQPEYVKTMPLILTPTSTWPTLESTTGYVKVKPGQTVMFSCPNDKNKRNVLKNLPRLNETIAVCDKQDKFIVENTPYKLSELQCIEEISPIVKERHMKCLSETSELIRVGFEVHGFLETYEVCFDTSNKIPLYTRALMAKSNRGPGTRYSWLQYHGQMGGTDKNDRYTCVGSSTRDCYSKAQLVNARDFGDGPAQKSTFIDPLNAVPLWHPIDTVESPWDVLDYMIRTRLSIYEQFVAWSGTHMLQKINGNVIPRYLWKVVRFDEDTSIAIVYINGPSPSNADIYCTNICPEKNTVPWISEVNKHMYCCEVNDFLVAFKLGGTTIGEPVEAAVGKIMSKI